MTDAIEDELPDMAIGEPTLASFVETAAQIALSTFVTEQVIECIEDHVTVIYRYYGHETIMHYTQSHLLDASERMARVIAKAFTDLMESRNVT